MNIKQTIRNTWTGIAFVAALTACGDDGDDKKSGSSTAFSVSPLTITIADNGFATVAITSGADWYVSAITENWLTATPTSGKGNASVTLQTVSENNSKQLRTAQVVITEQSSSQSFIVNVTQQPPTPKLSAEKSYLSFTNEPGEQVITITSNDSWTAQSSASWCSVSPRMGTNNGTLKVTVTQNAALMPRTAIVTITSSNNSLQPVTIEVSQEGVDFTVLPLALTIDDVNTSSFTVKTSSAWYVSNISENWLTVTPVSGRGDATLTLKAVGLNNSRSVRTAQIQITEASALLVQTVNVSQLPAPPTMVLESNRLDFTCNGGERTITITSNIGWTVATSSSWCTVSPRTGINNGNLKVTVTANEAPTPRSATIVITPDDNSLQPIEVQVSQQEYVETKPGENDNTIPVFSRQK